MDLSREELSPHALYMRLRCLCTPTGTGRLQVSQEVADQWSSGNRDELQLALVMALKQHGYDDTTAVRKLMRVGQGFPKKNNLTSEFTCPKSSYKVAFFATNWDMILGSFQATISHLRNRKIINSKLPLARGYGTVFRRVFIHLDLL